MIRSLWILVKDDRGQSRLPTPPDRSQSCVLSVHSSDPDIWITNTSPKAAEMAAEERLEKLLMCVKACVIFLSILTFEPFYFPHGEQALSRTRAGFPNMHCFSRAIICSLCFFQ